LHQALFGQRVALVKFLNQRDHEVYEIVLRQFILLLLPKKAFQSLRCVLSVDGAQSALRREKLNRIDRRADVPVLEILLHVNLGLVRGASRET